MKIKNWNKFVKLNESEESLDQTMASKIRNWIKFNEGQLDMFSDTLYERPELIYKSLYVFTPEDLEDYFIDFIDDGWSVRFFYGFWSELYDIDSLIIKRDMLPLIRVYIDGVSGSKGGDYLTNSLLSALNRFTPRFKKVKVFDEGGSLNPKDLKFEGSSIFIKSDSDNIEDEIEVESSLMIDLIWIKEVYLTDKMIFTYYEFEEEFKEGDLKYDEKGNAFVGFPVEDIKDWVLDKKSRYRDVVGDKDMMDSDFYYDSGVDDDSIFSYYFDSETKRLLLEKCIGEEFENSKGEWNFLSSYNSLEDLIGATIKGGWNNRNLYKQLGEMLSEISDVYEQLKEIYDGYYGSAKMDSDYDAIMSSFYGIVEDVLGTPIVEEYEKDYKTWYKLKFKFEWLEYEDDPEYIKKEGLEYIISNWCHRNYDYRKLNPRFSDSADIDTKEFNLECQNILKNLNKSKD